MSVGNGNGFDKMTVKELRDLKNKVEGLIARKMSEEKDALRAKIAAMAAEHGMSVNELFAGKTAKTKGGKASKPIEIKFRNPKNPDETWSGRGRRPMWMAGKDPEAYRIGA